MKTSNQTSFNTSKLTKIYIEGLEYISNIYIYK